MNIIDINLPDLSNHPQPPHVGLGVYEKWMFDSLAAGMRPPMTDEEIVADFMRNEGSQKEPWPDFGWRRPVIAATDGRGGGGEGGP